MVVTTVGKQSLRDSSCITYFSLIDFPHNKVVSSVQVHLGVLGVSREQRKGAGNVANMKEETRLDLGEDFARPHRR